MPKQEYRPFQSDCPFEFELPTYATVSRDSAAKLSDCWLNVDFLPFKGTLYMSYKPVNGNLQQLADDCRNMAMKHTAKASGIDEKSYTDDVNQVFGLMYDLKGSAASPMQFWLTDSTHHFVRGSLYFYAVPNPDSIAPVLSQVRADLTHMIESFRWK